MKKKLFLIFSLLIGLSNYSFSFQSSEKNNLKILILDLNVNKVNIGEDIVYTEKKNYL